jgi:protein-tyrosine phosphatase
MNDPAKIRPFIDLGCWLQLTAGSLAGQFGPRVEATAYTILEMDAWCVMASDAHDATHRPPVLREGHDAVTQRLGVQFADELARHRPGRIIGRTTAPATKPHTLA